MLPRKPPTVALILLVCLLLPLASCAKTPAGESLEKSLEADPRLTEQETATTTATTTVTSEKPQPQAQRPAQQTTPSPSASAVTLPQISSFSSSTTLGASGTSKDPQTTLVQTKSDHFSDLNKTPKELRSYVEDMAKLGVLTSYSSGAKQNSATSNILFEPNQGITRREFVRWLFDANNRLYATRSTQQIRSGLAMEKPAFRDVPRNDPDFAAIQGLAEAGILPSPLSGDNTVVTFQPDKPLTRETLLLWKVPVDIRQALPMATVDAVKQTWGFQDAAKISPRGMRAVLADFQNGDSSNIRRAFGYTLLFQPKKIVTRAEAAAAVWYFGIEGEGQSAQEALKQQDSTESSSESSSN